MISYQEQSLHSKDRLTKVMFLSLCLACGILIRAACIQLLVNPRLEVMARRQFFSNFLIRPQRGAILDRAGEPLAINVDVNSLAANPSKILNRRRVARLLSRATNLSMTRLLEKLKEKREFVWIKRHLSKIEMGNFKKWRILDSEGDWLRGLWIVKESDRVYPHGQLAAHILGDVNVDSDGIEGIELWMNSSLRGKIASVAAVKDALGRPTFIDGDTKGAQEGETIDLTLDSSLQFEVEQHLGHAVQRTGARGGTVIVMNASNGEILALANEPTFNPNSKAGGSGQGFEARRNRALTDGYEPGSTLKALLLASALSNGSKLSDQVWAERGSFEVQNHKISEAEAHEKYGWLSLKKMIQFSSNVVAAKVALKLGVDRYLKTLRSFGLGQKTGIGFPGEISGRIPHKKDWGPLTLANIGFGQGILVTPIQMIRAYAAIANGGWLVQPTIVKRTNLQPEGLSTRILTSKVSREVTDALLTVTEEGGTGVKAALSGYRVAGKTGTSQRIDPQTGKYSREKYVASFIGFPVEMDSKIVIFTSLLEPEGVYYASETAAPLFREILNSVANHIGLPARVAPVQASVSRQDTLQMTQAAPKVSSEVPSASSALVLPSFKGLTPREAVQLLKGHRLNLEFAGSGIVSSQFPQSGSQVKEGDRIRFGLVEP